MPSDLVEVGFCSKPHGIKGAFHFVLGNTEDSILENGMEIFLFPSKEKSELSKSGERFTIERITFGHKVMAYLSGINDRNIVEKMLPFTIKVPRSIFPEVDDNEIYITDIIGCIAFNVDNGEEVGKVFDYYDNGAQLVLKINSKSGVVETPFVDQFVPEVDLDNKKISIRILEFV